MSPKRTMHPMAALQRERRLSQFSEFLRALVKELNDLSGEGTAVLVEGKRDARALTELGYTGPLFTVAILTSSLAARERLREDVRQMVILTDLDGEGRRLASRYVKFLAQAGGQALPGAEEAALRGVAGGLPAHREPREVRPRRRALADLG